MFDIYTSFTIGSPAAQVQVPVKVVSINGTEFAHIIVVFWLSGHLLVSL